MLCRDMNKAPIFPIDTKGLLQGQTVEGVFSPDYSPAARVITSVEHASEGTSMPESLRFLLYILVIAGVGYAALWYLSSFPPAPVEVVKELPHDKFND